MQKCYDNFLIFYKTKLCNDKIAKLFEGKTISLKICLFSYIGKTENLDNSRGKRLKIRDPCWKSTNFLDLDLVEDGYKSIYQMSLFDS